MLHAPNIPAAATEFIGRLRDVDELLGLLTRPDVRLVTVTGSAGVGKTRLAMEAATRVASSFDGFVCFVPLADVRDGDLVASAIVAALGGGDVGAGDSVERIAEVTRDVRSLLVLDNFEQVLRAAPVVAVLLERCPGLTILTTSRHPLQIRAEWCYQVAPFTLPPVGASDAEVVSSDVVTFFVSRLNQLDRTLAREADVGVLVDICRMLDGLPLAIELVAARSRLLSLTKIRESLDRRLELLTRGGKDMPDRQRTMRDALAWSYELLEETSRAVLRRLGVCVGGARIETATALVADLRLSWAETVDALDDLVAHSLIDRAPDGRLRMLEVVREFAIEELASTSELEAALTAHAQHFLRVAEEASEHLSGSQQRAWLDRLYADGPNFTAAVRTAISRADAELALRLCLPLRFLWYVRGPLLEGQAFFASALALPGASQPLRGSALVEAAAIARHAGQLDVAHRLANEALSIAREVGGATLISTALLQFGFICHLRGRYDQARSALEECVAFRRANNDLLGEARALHHLGLVTYYGDGDAEGAWKIQGRCLNAFRELHNERHEATVLIAMTELARARHAPGDARALLEQGLSLVERLQDLPLVSYALYIAAALAADDSRPSVAMRLLGAAEAAQRACGAPPWPAVAAGVEHWLPLVTSRLGRPRAERLRAAGAKLPAPDAIALAIGADEGIPRGLTAREWEIATLVASGLGNKAIAAKLVMSDRTVDGHVAHIMTKTGFTSRSQIATWVVTHEQ